MVKTQTDEEAARTIGARVAALPTMDKAQLLKVWIQLFPTPPPPTLRKQLMVPVLSYRIQEEAFGGLSQSARKRLDVLIAKNREAPSRAAKAAKPAATARLIRGWRLEQWWQEGAGLATHTRAMSIWSTVFKRL